MGFFGDMGSATFGAFSKRFPNIASKLYGGRRDLYVALGYKRELFIKDYRSRFMRNEVANRVVKALPNATWRGGAEVCEDRDPDIITPFEEAFEALDKRLKIWDTLRRADILAGIGRYAVILIGAPGELDEPLESVTGPDDIAYLRPYGEDDAVIQSFDLDSKSPRFGLPVFYAIARTQSTTALSQVTTAQQGSKRVHWTRVLHIADNLLEDSVYGEPRLQCIWNRLDDLEKVAGGGSEAFWRRADQGVLFNVEDDLEVDEAGEQKFDEQMQKYEHGLKRYLLTRGVTATPLGSDVAGLNDPVLSLMSLISVGTGIPQRILMGSEQAKLAAKMDRGNWDDRVSDRREAYAEPIVARPAIDRFIKLGALPEPTQPYVIEFPELKILDDQQRAEVADLWAGLNQKAGTTVVTADEIRTRVLNLPVLSEVQPEGAQPIQQKNLKESERWAHVHAAADKFRRSSAAVRDFRVRRRKKGGYQG